MMICKNCITLKYKLTKLLAINCSITYYNALIEMSVKHIGGGLYICY